MNSMKRQKDRTLKDELPRSVGAQYATGEEWRNNSRKNEETEPKRKQCPVMDVTGDGSKVQCSKEQYCIGPGMLGPWIKVNWKWSNRNIKILRTSEIRWTRMGEFNSDDHFIYYCGQESLRRNGIALIVNKRVRNAVFGYNLKNDRMISVHFQGKPFNITVIQVYAPTSNAEEAEVKWFYEDLQGLLELAPKKDVLFIIGDWNAKVGSQEMPGVTGRLVPGVQNEAGQRLTEFCQENALVTANTLFQQHKRRLYTWTSPDGHYWDWLYSLQSKMDTLYRVSTNKTGSWLWGSDRELLIAKARLKLKKVGKTTRPFRYDINQITWLYSGSDK